MEAWRILKATNEDNINIRVPSKSRFSYLSKHNNLRTQTTRYHNGVKSGYLPSETLNSIAPTTKQRTPNLIASSTCSTLVANTANTGLNEKVLVLAWHNGSVLFVGRLAEYKYYDMDQAALRALSLFEKEVAQLVQ